MQKLAETLTVAFGLAAIGSCAGAQIPSTPGWEVIAPAGLVCADGSPWKFFVSPGDNKKVVVDFQGGGACWNEATCDPQKGTFQRTVSTGELEYAQGIYNRASAVNPFKGWSHVFVPYCTGDIHWGNAEAKYGNLSIQHKGAVNARAALEYVYQKYTDPSNVFVTGCSAGAYGSALWAPSIMRQYPKARVAQFGDSGLGITNPDFAALAFNTWKASGAIPDLPGLEAFRADPGKIRVEEIYKAAARAFPSNSFAQFTANLDAVQVFFYALGKGEAQPTQPSALEWVQGAFKSLTDIKTAAPQNYSSYVAPGSGHCIIPSPAFYTTRVKDVALVNWVRELVTKSPSDVIALPQ
jgi:Pectinacetylesterase